MKDMQSTGKVKALFLLMRPSQWVKNIILFLPLFFAQEIGALDRLQNVALLFAGFCMLTSGVYVFNDLMDAAEDRLHPAKRFRPIAARKVSPVEAAGFMLLLYGISAVCFNFIHTSSNLIWLLAGGYILLNLAYTLYLKQVQIIDVMIVACGFIIRLEAGATAGDIELSHWLIIMTFILSLFLAFAKRRDDLLNFMETGQVSRKNITGYTIDYLNVVLSFLSSIIAVTYILYTLSPEVTARSSEYLYVTIPFVLAGIMRYLQIILVEKSNCNPTDILLQDRTLQLTVAGWFVVFALLIY